MGKKSIVFIVIGFGLLLIMVALQILINIYLLNFVRTDKIYDANILKVVEIKVFDEEEKFGFATGCFISTDGMILTNKHVIFNQNTNNFYSNVLIRSAEDDEYTRANILRVSDTDDLALIKIEKQPSCCFKFGESVSNGSTIFSIGNPCGFGLSFIQGVVSSNLRQVDYNGKSTNAIQTSFVINEGNSGGPVFDSMGKLLGIISFRLKDNKGDLIQGCSFAIPISVIKQFIYNK